MSGKYDAVTSAELAEILGVTPRAVRIWIAGGCPLASAKKNHRSKKFCVRDVVDWLVTRAKRGDDENKNLDDLGDVANHGEVIREMTSVLRHSENATARVAAAKFLAEHGATKTETAPRVLAFVEIANVDNAISAISAHGQCPHCGKDIS